MIAPLKNSSVVTPLRSFLKYVDGRALVVAGSLFVLTALYPVFVFGSINKRIILCKVLQFILAYIAAHELRIFLRERRSNLGLNYAIKAFIVFFAIEFVLLLLLYPGGWRWDDIGVLNQTVPSGNWPTWQSYLTAVFYMLCYLTLPTPSFIVFVQILIICLMSAYVAYRMRENCGKFDKCIIVFMSIVLLLPPVINMNLYPLRAALHTYFLLFVLFLIYDRYASGRSWTVGSVVFLAALSAIVIILRTEYITMAVILPILFLALYPRQSRGLRTKAKQCFAFTGLVVLFSICLGYYQFSHISEEYAVTAYAPTLPAYAHQALDDGNEDLINQFEEVFNIDALDKAYEDGVSGGALYWANYSGRGDYVFQKAHGDPANGDYYSQCRKVFIAATLEYPELLVSSKLSLFFEGIQRNIYTPRYTTDLFRSNDKDFELFKERNKLVGPISSRVRDGFASFIEGTGAGFQWVSGFYNIFYYVPLYVAALIICLIRKDRFGLLAIVVLVQSMVIVISAPDCFFMYYYPFYLFAFWIIAWMFGLVLRMRAKRLTRSAVSP